MKTYTTDDEKKSFYNSSEWRNIRQQALERDHYECLHCRDNGFVTVDSIREDGKPKQVKLNVDHIYPIEYYPEWALTLENTQTLCIYHHNLKEGRLFRKQEPKWNDEWW